MVVKGETKTVVPPLGGFVLRMGGLNSLLVDGALMVVMVVVFQETVTGSTEVVGMDSVVVTRCEGVEVWGILVVVLAATFVVLSFTEAVVVSC